MNKGQGGVSIGMAALITGLTLFVTTAPYAEFYVFKKLLVSDDATKTAQNLLHHPDLFLSGIFAILFTYIKDVVLAWTLYIFLRPVNALLSLLACLFRIVYVCIAIVALFNYLYAYHLVNGSSLQGNFTNEQVLQWVNARRFGMHFAYIFFGIYLVVIGILIYKSTYIPKLLGVLMMLAGASWIMISFRPYFFKEHDFSWMMVFSIGELLFVIWLLVKGRRIKESDLVT